MGIDTMSAVSAAEAARQAGITYRQLDYWLRQGIIKVTGEATPGSGHRRTFTRTEVAALRELVQQRKEALVVLDMFTAGVLWDMVVQAVADEGQDHPRP